jgi:hypothetical protein
MTDTRLPSRWLLDPAMEQLSDRAWRTFTGSLMWSNEAGTDGFMPRRSLRYFHPEGVDSATLGEILAAGLWVEDGQDLRVPDWEKNGQELRETVEARRAGNRQRNRSYRQRKKGTVTRDVTHHVTRSEEDRQGQDRQGQDRQGQDRQGQDRQGQDEVLSHPEKPKVVSWLTVVPPIVPVPESLGVDEPAPWPPGESPFGGAA